MKISKHHLKQVAAVLMLSTPLFFFFQNCAQHGFDKNGQPLENTASEKEAPSQVSAETVSEASDAPERQPAQIDAETLRRQEVDYAAARENLIASDGHLVPKEWAARVWQMTDLESNMTEENKQDVINVGTEVLSQLVSEVGANDNLTTAQVRAMESSLSLLSYGIKSPQDRAEMTSYFLSRTQNSELASKLSKRFATVR